MLLLLDNPKRGDKLEVTRELMFGKGQYTETCTIVAVWDGKIMLDNGEILRYFPKY